MMNPRIVISANATLDEVYAANELRAAFAEYQGATVEIVTDDAVASNEDIYVGKTAYSENVPAGNAYSVTTSGTRVYVSAGSTYGFEAAVAAVREQLKTNGCLVSGLELHGNGDALKTCNQKQEGQIRFLTYNVYGYGGTPGIPSVRQPYQLSLLKTYDADILAFQEFSNENVSKGYKSYRYEYFLNGIAALGYAEVGAGTLLNPDGTNYTPLFYKTDVLSVADCGFAPYSDTGDNSKSITWAVFSVKETGEKFIAMSTHFMWNDEKLATDAESDYKVIADSIRQKNAAELLTLLSEIREKHGELSVVIGGDLNVSFARERNTPLTQLESGGLTWAQGAADELGCSVNSVNGHGAYATWDEEAGLFTSYASHVDQDATYSIDHIWYNGVSVELFATVTDRYACFASDHNPKIMDFSLS